MITEDYVSFEIAKLLKDKGFDWPCHATYDTAVTGGKPKFSEYEVLSFFPHGMKNTDDKYSMVISAPTHQMVMKWLREVHKIYVDIGIYVITKDMLKYNINVYHNKDREDSMYSGIHLTKECTKYEDACEVAIKYCLKNLI